MFVRPERRPVAVVFQDYLLFPNLTALENVAFGLRARGVAKARRARPTRRQRGWSASGSPTTPATDRAPCPAGRPSASPWPAPWPPNLGCCCSTNRSPPSTPAPAADVRRDLRRHLATFDGVRLLVTHDPVDAYALADRVVILEAGRVVQTGTLADVTAQPRSRYVADLVGVNLLARHRHRRRDHHRHRRHASSPPTPSTATTFAVIQPHAVALYPSPPEGSPRNVWARHRRRRRPPGRPRPRPPRRRRPARRRDHAGRARRPRACGPATPIWASVKATEITTYPA